jgi:hypothetical protein
MAEQLRRPFGKFVDSSYSKKRPSSHLRKVPIRSNKVSSRTFQTALVFQLNTTFLVSPDSDCLKMFSYLLFQVSECLGFASSTSEFADALAMVTCNVKTSITLILL